MVPTILTALLVGVTAVYAWLTHGILKANQRTVEQMRLQAEALTRPYVTVGTFVPPRGSVLYLRIRNTGRTAAKNTRLRIDRDFWQFGDESLRNLRDLVAFTQPLGSFAPGNELVIGLAPSALVFGDDADPNVTPLRFTITASYSFGSRRVRESTTVDLTPYEGTQSEPDPGLDQLKSLAKSTEKLSKDVREAVRMASRP